MRFFPLVLFLALAAGMSCQTYPTGMQQSVARAGETAAIAAMKSISTAQQAYALNNGGNYGTFQQLCEAGFLDARFNSSKPQVQDYVLTMEASGASYSVNADPQRVGEAAGRHLFMNSTSPEIHVNNTQPASASDPVMQF